MASIRKFRDKWRAEIRRQGHKSMSKMFITRKAAQKWARETEVALESGDLHNLSNKTMADLIDRYLEEADIPKSEQTILQWWKTEVGHIKLREVRRSHIVTARKSLHKLKASTGPNRGQPITNATVNRRVALLSRVCAIAVEEWDWLKDNPGHVKALPEDNARDRLLSDDERKALAKALVDHVDPVMLGFVLVAEASGMRAGEIVGLKWKDISTDTGLIELQKTKNGEKRAVAVTGDALVWLRAWKKDNALRFGGYIFGNRTGHYPLYYRKDWGVIKNAAGIEDFKFHDLRHGFVTAALRAKANPVMVSLVTGHKSTHMLKRYAHLVGDVALEISQTVDNAKVRDES